MLLHLVLVAWMAPMVAAGAHCSNPLPGSLVLMQGVDLSTFEIDNLNFKRPVIDATCNEAKKRHLGETAYDLPDQVATWYRQNSGSFTADTRIIETMSDVTNKLSVGVTVEGSYGPVSGSASVKYSEMQRNIAENKYFYSILDAKTKTGRMNLQMQLTMSESAKHILSSIEQPFKEAPEPYLRFIKTFGTHYFSSGSFGGVIRAEFKIKSSLKKKYSSEDLAVQTKLAYNGLVASASVEVNVGTSTDQAKSDFQKSSSSSINYYGGNDNIAKNGLKEWQPTVLKSPNLMSGRLSPISDLLKDHPKLQEQLELAVDSYYRGMIKTSILKTIRGIYDPRWEQFDFDLESGVYATSSVEDIQAKFEDIASLISECWYGSPENYVGTRSTTATGRTCQHWGSQFPHRHEWGKHQDHFAQDDTIPKNYCRTSIDGPAEPWCYTRDPNKRWETCGAISECKIETTENCPTYTAITHISGCDVCATDDDVYIHLNVFNNDYLYSIGVSSIASTNLNAGNKFKIGQSSRTSLGQLCLENPDESKYKGPAKWKNSVPQSLYLSKSGDDGVGSVFVVMEIQYPDGATGYYPYMCIDNCFIAMQDPEPATFTPWLPYCPEQRFTETNISNLRCMNGQCYTPGKPELYRGTVTKTKSGKTCQHWYQSYKTPQSERHIHGAKKQNFPADSGRFPENFCRAPTDSPATVPWCYTVPDGRVEECDVPTC